MLRYLAMAGQLGLSMVLPMIGCTWAAVWLCNRFALPRGIILLGILLGIAGAGISFARFSKMMQQASQTAQKEEKHAKEEQSGAN